MTDTNSLAVRDAANLEQSSGALALRGDQTDWTPMQRAALTHLGIEDAPAGDQQVFLHVSQRNGLDPFARQIYMIPRKERGKNGQPDTIKWTIQTGIDGFRLIAERHPQYAGTLDPEWCGQDGKWRETWTDRQPPTMARVKVLRHDRAHPISLPVKFSEFAATFSNGDLQGQWKTKPAHMIAKVAEAAALRKAFPQDLSGMVTDDEMGRENSGTSDSTAYGNVIDGTIDDGALTADELTGAAPRSASPETAPSSTSPPPTDCGQVPIESRRTEVIRNFADLDVTEADIVRKLGKPTSAWSAQDIAQLWAIGRRLQHGEITRDQEFPPETHGEGESGNESAPDRIAADAAQTAAEASQEPPTSETAPRELVDKIKQQLTKTECTQAAEQIHVLSMIVRRRLPNTASMTTAEAQHAAEQLGRCTVQDNPAAALDHLLGELEAQRGDGT